ncbi:MAG TPA: ABC transporter substrate-binding protein [Alphaproteobacteria bacterium]|jgi:NitT/TauT family transport system substrate-binding protein
MKTFTAAAFGKLSAALMAPAFLAFAFVAHPAQALEPMKVSLAAATANYAPYFVAIEKGYYREEGFDVEIVHAPGAAATAALLSGDLPFSTSGAAAMSAAMKGAPLKLVLFPWSRPTFQIWSTKPDIKTLADLKGKTIGIQSRGDTFEIALRMAFMANGIDPSAVSYTALGIGNGRFATLVSGSLPAAMVSRIDVQKLREMGALDKGNMVYDMYANNVRMPLTSLAVNAALIQKDRERVKRFIRASIKGFRYATELKEPTLDILMKYNDVGRTREAAAADYDDVVASRSEDGTVPPASLQTEITVRGQIMEMPADKLPKADKVFDLSMANEVNKELAASGWKPTP